MVTPGQKALRIVLIEDNEDAAEVLSIMLEAQGHEVKVAPDGASGIKLVETFAPDVVFSDIGLPGEMDGHQVARSIRQLPNGTRPVVVALSGYGQDSDKRYALDAGFDAHLTKPVDGKALEGLLRTVAAKAVTSARNEG